MTFLNPAILFGLIAAGIPILLHFLNLRKLKRIEFSSIKFLKELQQTKIKRLKFKRLLLLVLRVLLIVSIVAAFARPSIKSNIPIADSSTEKTIFFLLDNSYSMSYVESNGSLFNQAKNIIETVLSMEEGNNHYYVFTTTGDSIDFASNEINRNKLLETISINDIAGNLNNALEKISEVSKKEQTFIHELYILSDLQTSNIDTSGIDNIFKTNDKIKTITLFDFSTESINNRSISGIELNNQIIRPGSDITIQANVTNHSETSLTNQTASMFINGKRRSLKSFDLKADESKTISFNTTLTDSGFVFVRLETEEDDIGNDNNAYLSFYVPPKINVNIYSDNKQDHLFLKTALEKSYSVEVNTYSLNRYNTSYADDNAVSILFITDRPVDLSRSLSGGERVMVFPGQNVSEDVYAASLNGLGISGISFQDNTLLHFKDLRYEHPILRDMFENDKNKITSPSVYKVLRRGITGNEIPVLTLSDGTPMFSEIRKGDGILLLSSVSPVLQWSDLPLKSIFAPLILKSVFYLSGRFTPEQKYAGESILVNTKLVKDQFRVSKPKGEDEFVSNDKIIGKNSFTYTNTSEAGFYKFYSGNKLIAVTGLNIDPKESSGKYYSSSEIKNVFDKQGRYTRVISRQDNIESKLSNAETDYEIWKHFLLAAILLAIAEMFVARTTKNELITTGDE